MQSDMVEPDLGVGDGNVVAESWGYILRASGASARHGSLLLEVMAGVVGTGLLIAALGQWIFPGVILTHDVIGVKTAVTTFFLMGGAILLRYSWRGFRTEIHLDRLRGEIRIVSRNRNQRVRLLDCILFGDIGSVGLEPEPGDHSAKLALRLRATGEVLELAAGPVRLLEPIARMLARDIERAERGGPQSGSGDLSRIPPLRGLAGATAILAR